MTARAKNLLAAAGIVAGADILIAAAIVWVRYATGPTLRLGNGYPDFFIYSALGHQLRDHGFAGLYDLPLQHSYQQAATGRGATLLPFIAPPYAAPLYYPLGFVDLRVAYAAWAVATAALLALAVVLLVRAAGLRGRDAWAVGLLGAAWLPVLVSVLQAQTTGLVVLGLALAAIAWNRGREAAAGAWALPALLRPHMILLVPLAFAVRSPRRALAVFVAGTLAICLVTLPLVGIGTWRDYLGLVSPWLVHGRALGFQQDAYSLRGVLPGALQLVAIAIVAAAVLALTIDVAAAIAGSVLISPYQNLHDLSLLVVPLVLAAGGIAAGRARRPVLGWIAAGACYLGVDLALIWAPAAVIGTAALVAYLAAEGPVARIEP